MGKIITVHENYEEFNKEWYINTDYIIYFHKNTNKSATDLCILTGDKRLLIEVTETPEKIMKLITSGIIYSTT